MDYKRQGIAPRLIIHGGAGNILPSNLSPENYKKYHDSLLRIVSEAHYFQTHPSSFPLASASSATALDAATFAVTLLEDNPLFNSGHGAVFTRDGINELEASIMVSKGKKKRGVGVMGLQHVKNPIKLAREMLLHGEQDLDGGNGEHRTLIESGGVGGAGGAQAHSQLHKYSAEKLAEQWGLEMVDPSYFFVQTRWDEHMKGLEKEKNAGCATWDEEHFFSQGTCGAVALDSQGVIAVATSTGGLTNKLTGRIGDTPTLGAGFWAEEWEETPSPVEELLHRLPSGLVISESLKSLLADCLPSLSLYSPLAEQDNPTRNEKDKIFRSTAMSGTGNGDSFLRICAVRTASAISRYRPNTSLQSALTEIAGPGGELKKSAGDRWQKTGEGEGGIIGIELVVRTAENDETKSAKANIVSDFNCGGMYRASVDEHGKVVMRVWREGMYEGLEKYKEIGEGKVYDFKEWLDEKIMEA